MPGPGADGSLFEPGDEGVGVPIGVIEDFEYELVSIQLNAKEGLVLYTDGINEAPSKSGGMFGIERLKKLVTASAGDMQKLGKKIVADVQRFTEGTEQADDMCVVILSRA